MTYDLWHQYLTTHTWTTWHRCQPCRRISISRWDPTRYNWNCLPFGVSARDLWPVHLDLFWTMSNRVGKVRIHTHLKRVTKAQINQRNSKSTKTYSIQSSTAPARCLWSGKSGVGPISSLWVQEICYQLHPCRCSTPWRSLASAAFRMHSPLARCTDPKRTNRWKCRKIVTKISKSSVARCVVAWALWVYPKWLALHAHIWSIVWHTPHMHSMRWCNSVIRRILCERSAVWPIHVAIEAIFEHPLLGLSIAAMMASRAPEEYFNVRMNEKTIEHKRWGSALTKVTAIRQAHGNNAQTNATWRHDSTAPKAIAMKMPSDVDALPNVMIVPRIDGSL